MPDNDNISKECRAEVQQRFQQADAANPKGILDTLAEFFVGSAANTEGFRQLRYDAATGESKCREGEVPNLATFASVARSEPDQGGGRGGSR